MRSGLFHRPCLQWLAFSCLLVTGPIANAQVKGGGQTIVKPENLVVEKAQDPKAPKAPKGNLQGFLKFRHTLVNSTPFPMQFSMDYRSAFCGNDTGILQPGQQVTIKAGSCMLTGVITWATDSPEARKLGIQGKDVRWFHGGFSGDGTWIVTWDPQLKKFINTPHLNSMGDMISDQFFLALDTVGQGLLAPLNYFASLRSMYQCKAPDRPIVKTPSNEFQIMTLNTYCFPIGTTLALKEVVGKDLQSGIAKPVARRIPEMAQFIRQQGTDVAMFQELWSDDNKERMASNLCGDYPYCFYVPAEIPIVSMIVMDDGLMVVSKTPFIKCAKITFTERMGEEKLAQKGALLCAVKDREGKPMLIVNTHLQSGTEIEAVKIRARQMRGIGLAVKDMISKVPELKNCRIVVGGDVNEPLAFIQDRGLMTERTSYLTQELNTAGIQVNNDQMVMQQARKLGVKEIVSINEQTKVGIVRDLDLKEKRRLDKTGEESRHVERNGSWPGWPNPEATDPNATQVLDHFFLDKQTRLKEYKVFRQEILGGTGALNGSDLPKAAISDHAALKVTLTRGN